MLVRWCVCVVGSLFIIYEKCERVEKKVGGGQAWREEGLDIGGGNDRQ